MAFKQIDFTVRAMAELIFVADGGTLHLNDVEFEFNKT